MKLAEMKVLPRRAGLANLFFDKGDPFELPIRENDKIFLPFHPRADFHSLQNGNQFLFCSATWPVECWFGGTDEKPFLVQMRELALAAFRDSGENGFYASLKPRVIHDLERKFGISAKRQGDIFVILYPLEGKSLEVASFLHCWKWEEADGFSVFGTRHKLTGRQADDIAVLGGLHLLATGVLEAPDHTPLQLKGAHLLAQADNLYNSKMAD